MPRPIYITRDEAEGLVDILESLTPEQRKLWLSSNKPEVLSADIRKMFGMIPKDKE